MSPQVDIGDSLREARIRRGLTIKECEDATKIRRKYLEALEQDDFEVLPGPTYVKGFLRTYASFLKLDAESLVEMYRSRFQPRGEDTGGFKAEVASRRSTSRATDTKKRGPRRSQRGYALAAVLAVAIIAFLAWYGTSRGLDAASVGAENIATTTVSTGMIVGVNADPSGAGPGLGSGEDGEGAPTSAPAVTVSTAVNPAGSAGANGDAGAGITMVVRVTEGNCWLVVRKDGEDGVEVYAGTLSAGGQKTFQGANRYWMMVGRPESLTVTVGARSYTLAEPAGAFIITGAGVDRAG